MANCYYRGTEAALASGSQNLVDIVTPVPATYGLSAGEVTSYTTLTTNFADLLTLSTNPDTRTRPVIEQKNEAKRQLRAASVNIARTITAVQTVTNAMLLSLRLNERIIPQPRPVPPEAPVVEIRWVRGRLVELRIHSATTEGRAKPFGAIGANVYSFIGPAAPEDPRLFHYEGMATRSTTQIQFPDSVASGATVWISASWVSARGQSSQGSVPVSVTVQGGLLPAAQ